MKKQTLLAIAISSILPLTAWAASWITYIDASGIYKITYPSSWQILTKGNAVVITSPGGPDERAIFGITRRSQGTSAEEAVGKVFSDPQRSEDLQRTHASLGGLPAIKVWGSKKGDPSMRIVEYYVQKGPDQYYILFQAPFVRTSEFKPMFDGMIASMKFLK